MRIAVSLPNLPGTAIERQQIEAAVSQLGKLVHVEVFLEASRLLDGELPARAYHYLRLPERHATDPFDAALHIVGRDFRPYEVGVLMARRLPSVVWLLDTMTHHVLVGGLAPHGRWDRYGEILSEQNENGDAIAATIASGWGTRALFRTRDPLPVALGRENRMLAANAEVAGGLSFDAPVVPLPTDIPALRRRLRRMEKVETVAVVAPNLSWPGPELRALRALLRARPDVRVRYHLIKWFEGAVLGPARTLGVADEIEWIIEDGIEERPTVADSADVVVASTGDPTLNDRGLVYRAMAAGQVVVVMRAPAWDSLPGGAVVVLEPGREREAGLRETLLALVDDPALAKGVGAAAATHSGGVGAQETASLLLDQLKARVARRPLKLRRTAAAAVDRARELMVDYCTPHNASQTTRGLIGSRIDGILPDAAGPLAWRQ